MFSGPKRHTHGATAGKLSALIVDSRAQEGGPHMYLINCHCAGKSWQVAHSYSQFLELYEALRKRLKAVKMLKKDSSSLPPMPPKHMFAGSSDPEAPHLTLVL